MFDEHLYTLKCDTNWVDKILEEMYECLKSESLSKNRWWLEWARLRTMRIQKTTL